MIPNKEKESRHCLAIKEVSELLRGITLKHQSDLYV